MVPKKNIPPGGMVPNKNKGSFLYNTWFTKKYQHFHPVWDHSVWM